MVFSCLDTDLELAGDFLAAVAAGNEHGDLTFPRRQLIQHIIGMVGRSGERLAYRAIEVFAEPRLAVGEGIDGLAEFGERVGLVDETMDALLDQRADYVGFFLSRKNQDFRGGEGPVDATKHFDAAEAGHHHIEDQQVGT